MIKIRFFLFLFFFVLCVFNGCSFYLFSIVFVYYNIAHDQRYHQEDHHFQKKHILSPSFIIQYSLYGPLNHVIHPFNEPQHFFYRLEIRKMFLFTIAANTCKRRKRGMPNFEWLENIRKTSKINKQDIYMM